MGAIANPAEWHNLREAWGEGVDAASGKGSGTGIFKWAKFLKPIWGATGRAEFERQKGLIGGGYEAALQGKPLKAIGHLAASTLSGPETHTLPIEAKKKKKSSSLIGG